MSYQGCPKSDSKTQHLPSLPPNYPPWETLLKEEGFTAFHKWEKAKYQKF